MSQWTIRSNSVGDTHSTSHWASGHDLSVIRSTNRNVPEYWVRIRHPNSDRRQNLRAVRLEYQEGDSSAYLRPNADAHPVKVQPPSERLKSLIASHHENHAWMPLLDALAEEYPEHFSDAVAAHTAARQSDAATQYARAYNTVAASR